MGVRTCMTEFRSDFFVLFSLEHYFSLGNVNVSRDEEVLEAWLFTRQTSAGEENSKEDWAVVLESWNGSRRIAAQFPGNSQLGLLVLPIPQKAARGS